MKSAPACPCCALRGGFFPVLSGVPQDAAAPSADPHPSFVDKTPQTPTAHASAGDGHTRDLFEDAPADRWVVVRGATVVTMDDAGTLPAHDVLIRDGIVREVRPTGRPLPPEAIVVEAHGRPTARTVPTRCSTGEAAAARSVWFSETPMHSSTREGANDGR